MRGFGAGGVVVAMALAASAPVGAARIESTARRIPARVAAHRLLVVPVTVNGAGPYPFLLDTGATSSMVAADLARDLALPPLGHAVHETPTAAGSALLVQATLIRVTVRMASVGPLRAGRAAIPRFAAAMLADADGRAEDGLLPTALFEGVYFDNRAGAVVLNPRRSTLSAVP
jgi:hypothetical protein